MARVVNRGEACVRKWQRDNCYPPEAVDKLIEFLGSIGSGEIKTEIDVAMEEPFRATTDVYKWRMFCQGLLANEDAFLPDTFGEILSYSGQWLDVMSSIRKLEKVRQFDFYKKQLLSIESTRLNLPVSCQNQITDAKNWESLRPAITWLFVENFIYFLALAEVECLWLYHRIKEPKISRIVLPRLKKGTVQYPVKLFFGYFFDNLVTKGFHRSLGSIAGKIPRVLPLDKAGKESGKSRSRIDEDSGWREIKRAKYQGKAPAFETFKAWIDALIPSDIHSSPEELELEKQLLCDALGAARIIDRFFKDVSQNIPEKELLVRFESYDIWHRFHRTAIVDDV